MTLEDEKLLEMLYSGDREAFYHVMEKYNKLLWVIVGGILSGVGTNEDVEECISDVYVSLWLKPKAYDSRKGTLKTYLAIVARSKALDRYRKLTKVKIVELDEAISSSDDDLIEYIAKRDMYGELYEAIASLKEPDREILIRRYFFNEKPAVIAKKTSLPPKEIENRLYQSKIKLRNSLIKREEVYNGA